MRISSRRNVSMKGRAKRRVDLNNVTKFEVHASGEDSPESVTLVLNTAGKDHAGESRLVTVELSEAETATIIRVIAGSERARKAMLNAIVETTPTGY